MSTRVEEGYGLGETVKVRILVGSVETLVVGPGSLVATTDTPPPPCLASLP